jgi:hypothetical protein
MWRKVYFEYHKHYKAENLQANLLGEEQCSANIG